MGSVSAAAAAGAAAEEAATAADGAIITAQFAEVIIAPAGITTYDFNGIDFGHF